MTMDSQQMLSSTRTGRIRHIMLALLSIVCAACIALFIAGCSATDVDVYVMTSETVMSADGEPLTEIVYSVDSKGDAIEVTTNEATASGKFEIANEEHRFVEHDVYGVPEIMGAGDILALDLDDEGQPTLIMYEDLDGSTVTLTYAYSEVRARVDTVGYAAESPDYSIECTIRYDTDGWPLDGTLRMNDLECDVQFIYEITDSGAVTAQYVVVAGVTVLVYEYTYDDDVNVATRTNPDGTISAFTYELIADPSPYAMVEALTHEADVPQIVEYAELAGCF